MSKPVDVRNKLADKALELFNANGYEKTSVNSICAAANVSRTRFYSLFSLINQMIISKNPQFTGISARQQLEFTTHLLLTD